MIALRPLQELSHSLAAMAHAGLFLRREFGEGFRKGRGVEQRVIAEAHRSAWLAQNQSLGLAAKVRQLVPIPGGGNYADKACPALRLRKRLQLAE